MGQKYSYEKMSSALVTRPMDSPRVDKITVSYASSGCFRRRRRIVVFTFPRHRWWTKHGVAVCYARKGLSMPLEALQAKYGGMEVRVKVIGGGNRLITAGMTLSRLLDNVGYLRFSLYCHAGVAGGFTCLRCNGFCCEVPAAPAACPLPEGDPDCCRAASALSFWAVASDTVLARKGLTRLPEHPSLGQTGSDVALAPTPHADNGPTVSEVTPPASIPEASGAGEIKDVAGTATTQSRRRRTPKQASRQQKPPRRAPTPPYTLLDEILGGTAIVAVAVFSICLLAFYTMW